MAVKALDSSSLGLDENNTMTNNPTGLFVGNAQINDPMWWMQNQQYLGKDFTFSEMGTGRGNEGDTSYYEYTADPNSNGLIPYNPATAVTSGSTNVAFGGAPKGAAAYVTNPSGVQTIDGQQYLNPQDYNFQGEASDLNHQNNSINSVLGNIVETGVLGAAGGAIGGAIAAGAGLGAVSTGALQGGLTGGMRNGPEGALIGGVTGGIGAAANTYMPTPGSVTGSTAIDKLGESAITSAGKSLVGGSIAGLFGNSTSGNDSSSTGGNNMATTGTSANPTLTDITGLLNGITQTTSSALQGNAGKQADLAAAQQADPYQQYRSQAASQLNNLINNPGQVNGLGTAEAQAAQQAVERSGAAKGLMNSPAMALALQQQASNSTQSSFDDMFSKLSTLAGGNNAGASAKYTADSGQSAQSQINGVANGTAGILGSLANGLVGGADGTSGGGILGALGQGASSLYNSLFGGNGGSSINNTMFNGTTDFGQNAVSNVDTSGASSFLDNSGNINWSSLIP